MSTKPIWTFRFAAVFSIALLASGIASAGSDYLTLQQRVLQHRAFEAVVWSMPMMNYKYNRDGMFVHGGSFNDVFYFSKMQDWGFQVATPNDTTPYFICFWNTKENGPVVIEVPAASDEIAMFGTLMDSWHRPIEDVGPTGADEGKGAKYLILPPDYGDTAPDNYRVYRQKTFQGYFIFRPIIPNSDQASVDLASQYLKQLKVYNLGGSKRTKYVDLAGRVVESITTFDDSYFDHLNEIIQQEPIEEKDHVMTGMLKSFGIVKGKHFAPSEEQRVWLRTAAQDAHDYLLNMYHNVLMPLYYEGKHWRNLVNESVPQTGFTFLYPNYIDIDNRGAMYYAITSSVKNFGAASYYLSSAKDRNGDYLDGGKNYRLSVAAEVPARDFWSVVAYNLSTAAWIREQPKVGVSSKNLDLQTNADGSVDLYFGESAPKGKEANWIPTSSKQKFFVLFRFYGPEPAVFDKSWQLDDIAVMKSL